MLTVCCVQVGNYLGRGAEYVEKLRAGVARHLARPHEFVVVSEQPGLTGWWTKVALFQPGRFGGRILYLDLDSVIVGPLDRLAASKGIVHLKDWGWKKNDYCSAAMVWDAGEHAEIWENFAPDVPERFRGDQDYMTALGGWPALPDGIVCSYRYVARAAPPAGVSVVQMHGLPKPHQITTGWVPAAWG